MTHVVVIGGGIAGLAAAHSLATAGVAVTVVESTAAVGGKLRTSEVAGVAVDEGAESFLRRVPDALHLIAAVGLDDVLVSPVASTASVWARGRLRPIPVRTVLGVPSELAALRGVLSTAELARAQADRILPGHGPGEDAAVGEWVGRRLGRAVVERLVDPLLGGVYAGRADELSLAATIPRLPRDERSVLAAARRALPPVPDPAGPAPVFGSLATGMGSLPAAVKDAIEAHGGTVVLGRTVRRIEPTETGWRVVHGATTDQRSIAADAVVVAVPAAPAARLLAEVVPVAAGQLAAIEAASMAIVTTAWRRRDVPGGSTDSGYLVPAAAGRPVKAVTFASAKWAHLAHPDVVVVRCSIGRHRDVADLTRDDDELVGMAGAELTSYAGFSGRPVDSRVTRWGGGLPQYAVGHLSRVALIRRSVAAVPGLAVCGATYDGVGIPACVGSGRRAAAEVTAVGVAAGGQ